MGCSKKKVPVLRGLTLTVAKKGKQAICPPTIRAVVRFFNLGVGLCVGMNFMRTFQGLKDISTQASMPDFSPTNFSTPDFSTMNF